MIRKVSLATLTAFGFLFLSNAFLFPLLFPGGAGETYANARKAPLLGVHTAALVLTALLLAFLYPKWRREGSPWKEGAGFGFWMALLVALPTRLHIYAATTVEFPESMAVLLWIVVTWGASGALIGRIYGRAAGPS